MGVQTKSKKAFTDWFSRLGHDKEDEFLYLIGGILALIWLFNAALEFDNTWPILLGAVAIGEVLFLTLPKSRKFKDFSTTITMKTATVFFGFLIMSLEEVASMSVFFVESNNQVFYWAAWLVLGVVGGFVWLKFNQWIKSE